MQATPELYHEIISSGSRIGYQALVISATLVGGWLIRADAETWSLRVHQRWIIMGVALIGALIGCAIPGYFAGGWVEEIARTAPIAPKTVMGGLLLSFFFVAAYKFATGNNVETSDAFARGAIAMMAIGRIGCILQHCCFGRQASWGMDFGDGVSRIPVQYFEAFGLLLILVYIQFLHQHNRFPGRRLFIVFALYGLMRFFLEFWREPIAEQYFGIGFYQWVALFVLIVGLFQIIKRTIKYRSVASSTHSVA